MAGGAPDCLFVPDRAAARALLARGNSGGATLLPLNRATATVLAAGGAAFADPSALTSEAEKAGALATVVEAVRDANTRLDACGVPAGRRNFVALRLLRALSTAANLDGAARALGARPSIWRGRDAEPWSAAGEIGAPVRRAPATGGGSGFLPLLHPFGRDFAFDMRSDKVRTAPAPGMPRFVRLSAKPGATAAELVARNTIQALRGGARRVDVARALISLAPPPPVDARIGASLGATPLAAIASDWSPAVVALALSLLAEIEACRTALDTLLARHGVRLRAALFDFPTKPLEVALAEACSARGVPVVTESHGCVCVHGEGARREAALVLARGGYNWLADASHVAPRSPAQAEGMAGCAPALLRVNRLRPMPAPRESSSPFRVLLAPNFTPWSLSVPALAASCFEIHAVIEALAATVPALPGFALDLRVKVTTDDTPKARQMEPDRGLVPADVAPLFARHPAMRDVGAMSYGAVMEAADLVVTEGLTAVMIEALEYRKPVLLMNRSASRTPSLPAWRLADLERSQGRNPVYAAGCDDDVARLLGLIRDRHRDRPLADAELGRFCWTGAGAMTGSYPEAFFSAPGAGR